MFTTMNRAMNRASLHLRGRGEDMERGAALTEYGTLLFFVAITAFGALFLFGEEIINLFTETENDFGDARDAGVPPAD